MPLHADLWMSLSVGHRTREETSGETEASRPRLRSVLRRWTALVRRGRRRQTKAACDLRKDELVKARRTVENNTHRDSRCQPARGSGTGSELDVEKHCINPYHDCPIRRPVHRLSGSRSSLSYNCLAPTRVLQPALGRLSPKHNHHQLVVTSNRVA